MLRHLITLLFVSADSLLIAQDWAWAKNVGGNSNHAQFLNLSSDKWGNVYLLGSNSEKSVIAGTAVDSGQYIAKFTASGNPLWVVSLPFNTLDFDADADGNIYIGANFTETCNTFNSTFTSAGENDILLVKLNNAGQEQWARQYGNNRNNRVQSVKATRRCFSAGSTLSLLQLRISR